MNKTCPLSSLNNSNSVKECGDRCVLYEDGCLIKKALKCYIKAHEPLKMPSVEDYRYIQEALAKQPLMYLHPDLQYRED